MRVTRPCGRVALQLRGVVTGESDWNTHHKVWTNKEAGSNLIGVEIGADAIYSEFLL